VLITSRFDAAFIEPNASGSFGVTISPYLKPYLLQVKREFFKYNLGYVVRLKSFLLLDPVVRVGKALAVRPLFLDRVPV